MSREGVRAGDLIEIDGIKREVVEINPLHTVLLETGNWTAEGQPNWPQSPPDEQVRD